MNIKLIKSAKRHEIIQLYREAGWWLPEYDKDNSFVDKIAAGSFLFAGAFDDAGRMIGMGRSLSDGFSDAYIQDVTVLKSYRNQGIGGKIIRFLIAEMQQHGIDWIGLIGEPGTKHFYEKLGFRELKGDIPMQLEIGNSRTDNYR